MGDYIIQKVPLEPHEKILQSKNFPVMPILYLELLENKTKVAKEFLNRYYVPPKPTKTVSKPTTVEKPRDEEKIDPDEEKHEDENSHEKVDEIEQPIEEEVVHQDENDTTSPEEQLVNDRLKSVMDESKDDVGETIEEENENPHPPTLQELHQKKKIRMGNYVAEDDDETQKERNTVYFQYEVLRRMHPNANIPEFTMYSDPKLMSQKYEMLTKKLSLESSVENWKRYMIVFVMGCEVLLGKINFDMEGFAQQQIMSISTYDQLLVEMAEKSYVPSGTSKWSPEVRLLMMLTMNIVLFMVSKMIFKKTGTNLLGSINNVMLNNEERNMKGPN